MPWVMLAMLAAEAVKHYGVDKPQEDAKRQQMAAAQQFGPWINGFKGGGKADTYDPTQQQNLLAGLMQSGVGGYMMDQNVGDHELQTKLRQEQLKALQRKNGGGADALTQSLGSGSIGSNAQAGFDSRLDPTQNPWGNLGDSMTEGMGEGAQNPWLWDTAGVGATA